MSPKPSIAKSRRFSKLWGDLGFVSKLAVSLAKPTLELENQTWQMTSYTDGISSQDSRIFRMNLNYFEFRDSVLGSLLFSEFIRFVQSKGILHGLVVYRLC